MFTGRKLIVFFDSHVFITSKNVPPNRRYSRSKYGPLAAVFDQIFECPVDRMGT